MKMDLQFAEPNSRAKMESLTLIIYSVLQIIFVYKQLCPEQGRAIANILHNLKTCNFII